MIEADKRAIQVKELWRRWDDARKDWADHAREDIDFYLGNHFSDAEASELESRNQSNLPLDRLYSAIEQFKAIITSKPYQMVMKYSNKLFMTMLLQVLVIFMHM